MVFSKRIKKAFTLPTLGDVMQNARPHQPGAEDAVAMAAYPRLAQGRVLESHGITDATGIYIAKSHCEISAGIPARHEIIIGETDSGKTTYLLKLIQELAAKTDWHIWVFDGKGDPDFARDVRAILYPYRGDVPIVQVGTGALGAPFNGFDGDATSIRNRLEKLAGIDQLEGNARHFQNAHTLCLQILCGELPGARPGPPRSFEEVEQRLDIEGWLKPTYSGYPKYHIIDRVLARTQYGVPYEEIGLELLNIITELGPIVRPDGRAPKDGSLIFQLCEPNAPKTTKRFFAFVVEVLKSQMIEMKKLDKKGIILVDEFPAFENTSIKGLLSMARSFGVGVVPATQSTVSIGEPHIKQMLMANTTTLVSFRVPYPGSRDVAEIAGLVKEPHVSLRMEDGSIGADGTISEKETWSIPSGAIAQLPNGHAYILRQQQWVKVHFDRAVIPTHVPAPPVYTYPSPVIASPPPDESKPEVTKRTVVLPPANTPAQKKPKVKKR